MEPASLMVEAVAPQVPTLVAMGRVFSRVVGLRLAAQSRLWRERGALARTQDLETAERCILSSYVFPGSVVSWVQGMGV